MSKYTTEVRFLCESLSGLKESVGFSDTQAVIVAAAPKIFNFEWPIYDPSYKLPLEVKILRHFYTREIAYETAGLWQLKLCDKLNMIMPYYNKLYASELYTFNPLYDVDLTKDREANRETNTTGTNAASSEYSDVAGGEKNVSGEDSRSTQNTTSGNHWDLFQDTPQGGLTNVENEAYLTDARHITDAGTSNTTDSGTDERHETTLQERTGTNETTGSSTENIVDTDSYIEHVVGSNGGSSYSRKLLEFRETLLNIDAMIIEELNELFFLLW